MVILALLALYGAGTVAHQKGTRTVEAWSRHQSRQRRIRERQIERRQEHEDRQRAREQRRAQLASGSVDERLAQYKRDRIGGDDQRRYDPSNPSRHRRQRKWIVKMQSLLNGAKYPNQGPWR